MKGNCVFQAIRPHRKNNVREFPVPSRDVTTKLSLGGNNDVITELFLPMGSLALGTISGVKKVLAPSKCPSKWLIK
jgi:hypothetical protein